MPEHVSMTQDQLEQIFEKMSMRQADHDTLIEIRTIVKLNNDQYVKHREENIAAISEVKTSAKKAHERLDEEIKSRWIFAGVVLAITIIGGIFAIFQYLPQQGQGGA